MRVAVVIAMILAVAPNVAAADAGKALVVDVSRDSQDASRTIRRVWRDLAAAGFTGAEESVVAAVSSKMPVRSAEARTRRLGAAKDAYSLFELDRALELLAQVDRLLVDVDPAEIQAQLAERYILEALIQHSRGQRAAAIKAFRLAHRLDPDRKALDSGRYQPEVVALHRQAVRANARAKPVKLSLRTSPKATRVTVDGRLVSIKRGHARIDAGPHLVRLSYPGHTPAVVRIGDERSIKRALLPRKGDARLASLAAAARNGNRRWRNAAVAELAIAAGVQLVVLVRDKKATIYRTDTGERGPWIRVRSQSFANELGTAPVSKPELVVDSRSSRSRRSQPRDGDDDERWYQKPWVWLAIAGAVAIGGGTIAVVASSGQTEEQIGSFCFEGACQ